jgi:O-antigen ligase
MFYFQNPVLQYIYWFFPANTEAAAGLRSGITRFFGVNQAALLTAYYMMAKYGIRGIFSAKTPWRVLIFAVLVAASTLGGFRSFFIAFLLAFSIQFFLEGLHRTKLLPIMILGVLLIGAVTIPFVRQMPYSVQRALSFLPLPVDPLVRADADTSSTWRVELWKSILPQVPEYFWFGKGYVFSKRDFDYAINQYLGYEHAISEDESWAALAGDYHNGPLSVIIPFGIWGAAAFLWFLWAGVRVLYRNFRYGDPDLRIINAFLLAGFITRILVFMIIFGGFDGDMHFFVGYLGFSICLNHGMCRRPAPEPPGQRSIQDTVPVRSRMEPAFQRSRYRE